MPAPCYQAPLTDIRFCLQEVGKIGDLLRHSTHDRLSVELIDAILNEAAKFAQSVLSPLNHSGDREGCRRDETGQVFTPKGYLEAYKLFVENGWNAAPIHSEQGGQGLPRTLSVALEEMWNGANPAFALCPMLTQSAIALIGEHGTMEQRAQYLSMLVSGEWTGTMCMTEPEAGSDLGLIRTQARLENGQYLIKGSKIFITYGEHDLSDNIIHMVLARLPDAPEGVRGLSLFLVPKFLPGPDGLPGVRNDVYCASIEHKLGIHGSPTAVLVFGEKEGAVGTLIGKTNEGLAAMFTMMNAARLAVGIEGAGIAAYANQMAQSYAAERLQGRVPGGQSMVPIAQHPDVAQMLMTIKSHSEAMRALIVYAGRLSDLGHLMGQEAERTKARARFDLLVPVVKAHCTQTAFELSSLALQIFGGAGYIEETGIAQLLRDSRIGPVYEGTNGIQARDLVLRRVIADEGLAIKDFISEVWQCGVELEQTKAAALAPIALNLVQASKQLEVATLWVLQQHAESASKPEAKTALSWSAGSYLSLVGLVCEGFLMALLAFRAYQQLSGKNSVKRAGFSADYFSNQFLEEKIRAAQFFCTALLPQANMLALRVLQGENLAKI